MKYKIKQIKDVDNCEYSFKYYEQCKDKINLDDYEVVYEGEQEYADGLADYEQGQRELEDAFRELQDGEAELPDALQKLRDGEIKMGDKVNFCVPTGNFGDILAAYYAKRMGLPVGKLICAITHCGKKRRPNTSKGAGRRLARNCCEPSGLSTFGMSCPT